MKSHRAGNFLMLVLLLSAFALLTSAQESSSPENDSNSPKLTQEIRKTSPLPPCLYCRRMDNNAGFLVTYSYCNQTDECLMDSWNYINRQCTGKGWVRGSSYDLATCRPEEIACPGFKSTTEQYGVYKNTTWSLSPGSKCKISIDAS
jgi:hypothetical protein